MLSWSFVFASRVFVVSLITGDHQVTRRRAKLKRMDRVVILHPVNYNDALRFRAILEDISHRK